MIARVRPRMWTAEEDAVLHQLAGTQNYAAIACGIGRSVGSVHARIKTLGLADRMQRRAKLGTLRAVMIGTLLDAGFTAREVRDELGLEVAVQTVGDIGRGTTWGRQA